MNVSMCNRNGIWCVLMMWIINARFLFISHKKFICRLSFFSSPYARYIFNCDPNTQLNEHFNNYVVVFQYTSDFFLLFPFYNNDFPFALSTFRYFVEVYKQIDGTQVKKNGMKDNGVVKCLTNPFYKKVSIEFVFQ